MSNGDQTTFKEKFLELEYVTLRKEIEACQTRHFRMVAGALFSVPAIPAIANIIKANGSGLGPDIVALALLTPLPLIFLSLYLRFFHEHHMMGRCAKYIREQIEPTVEGVRGWETWLSEQKDEKIRISEQGEVNRVAFIYGTIFLVSVILAAPQVYAVFSALFSGAASTAAGWIAVGTALLFYASAYLYAKRTADRLKNEVDYLN